MIKILQRSLSVLVCILLLSSVSFAQEKETPKTSTPAPAEQPKATPTNKEQKPNTPVIDKKDDGGTGDGGTGDGDGKDKDPKDPDPKDGKTSSLSGGQADGTSPTASPEAAFQNKLLDIPVNTFTGTAQVPIPIYTLTEGNISIPITMNYTASGVKAHEVSAWTGMNWTLSASLNMLSRIVRGIPDEGKLEYSTYGSNSSSTRFGFYQHGLKAGNDLNSDSEPDLFLLNINGGSYKFTFGSTLYYDPITGKNYRKGVFFPDADIEVRVEYQNFTPWGEGAVNNNIGRFINWKITTPDGMVYTFAGTPETIEASFEIEAKTAQNQNVFDGGNELFRYQKNNQITAAWYLTKITAPFGNHIDFTYTSNRYAYYKLAEQEMQTNNCTFTSLTQSINKVYIQSGTLREIESQKVKVIFNKDVYTCIVNPDAGQPDQPDSLCSPSITYADYRDDVDTWLRIPRGGATTGWGRAAKKLNSITVIDKSTPTNSLDWSFEYENRVSGFYDLDPIQYNYSYAQVGNTHQTRMFLKKINLPDNNFYRFTYAYTSTIPSRLTRRIDHWGFFSNPTFSYLAGLIGKDYTRPCVSVGNSRDTDNSGFYAQYYTLDSLVSSTGNVITFAYDNHEASNFSGKIGGSRIREVKSIDLISGIKSSKTYDYVQADGLTSSGFIALKPLYHFTETNNNEQWNSGLYTQLLGQSGKPAVGYSRVVEKVNSLVIPITGVNNLGYTVTDYNQDLTEINLVLPIGGIVTQAYTVRPWQNHFYQDYANGVSTRSATYNTDNQLLTEKLSTYGYATSDNSAINGYKSFRLNGVNNNFVQSYTESLTKYRLASETIKAYSQDGTNPVVNTSTFTYKDQMSAAYKLAYPGKHNQVVKTESIDSYGYSNETFNKYAFDFDFGRDSTIDYQICYDIIFIPVDCNDPRVEPSHTETFYKYFPHIPNDLEAKGIYQLQQKKMGATVLETFAKKNGKVVAATYQNFYEDATTDHQVALGKESYAAQNLPLTDFAELLYTRTTTGETFEKDARYDLKTTVEKYNPLGMPKVIQTRYGARDSIVYDATNTLILEKHSNIRAYDKNRTKMEYDNVIFGISKEISTNNLEVRKEYYSNGKLKQTKDKDGNVLKHYQYYYRGQNDTDPHLNTGNTHNRIITRIPRIATTDALSLDYDQCMMSVSYMDGSGKLLQSVGFKASPNQKDMISGVTLFDKFGRPNKSILPIESNYDDGRYTHSGILSSQDLSSTPSQYPSDHVEDIQSVIEKASIFYNDPNPYTSIAEYENSPLSRALKTYGAGKSWRDNLKYTEVKYETATGIKKFTVLHDNTTVTVGTYSDYVLTKKTLIDERGSIVTEYTDKSGNIVQKDVQVDDTSYLTTAYIFDDIGRLRYILNPKAYNLLSGLASFDETNTAFAPNVYAFKYDGRNRVFQKHSPSLGWSTVIYNRLNQPVLTQDSQEKLSNTWNYLKYDGQGRSVQTGQLVNSLMAATIQRTFTSFSDEKQFEERNTDEGNVQKYTNRSYPDQFQSLINDTSLKTVSYYDDYSWRTFNEVYGSVTDYDYQPNPFNTSAYSSTNATGLGTGGFSKIEIFDDFLFPTVTYYDDKNRILQSIGYHNLKARNQADMQYNFIGETLKNRMVYRKQGDLNRIRTTEQTLDHLGRRKEYFYSLTEGSVNTVPRFKMSVLSYDNIGRLSNKSIEASPNVSASKKTGLWTDVNTWFSGLLPTISDAVVIEQGHTVTVPTNQTVTAGTLFDKGTLIFQTNSVLQMGTLAGVQKSALQSMNYSYNIKGQMIGVNLDASGNVNTSADKLFSYKLDYHEDSRYFNGLISKQTWKTNPLTAGGASVARYYEYTYDRSNRLLLADFNGLGAENYDVTTDYDVNGNIQHLQRNSKTGANTWGLIDNLTYNYFSDGDELSSVDDASGSTDGFRNGTNSGDDYEYYADGKLRKDLNRNIDLIEYNFLDLVSKVTRGNGDYIEYKYTSTGTKRQTKRHIGSVDSYTLFDGEMIYQYTGTDPNLNNFTVAEIQNEEGRFINGRLEYGYTDHLGNLRLSYRDSSGVAVIVQSGAYDPWGLEIKAFRYLVSGATQDKYTWNGKEDLTDDGLEGWSDFGWRIEDRTLGRWFTPDPADQFEGVSTYAYCLNNGVSNIDPDGRVLPAVAVGALIGAGISALTYTASVAFSEGGFNNWNWGSFAKSVGVGALSGALSGGVGSAYAESAKAGVQGVELARAFTHAIVQANVAAYTGGDVGSSLLSSFIGSGVGSATSGMSNAAQLGISAISGAGISTAINGGNFWENLAYSGIVVGANHLLHKGGEDKPKLKKKELDFINDKLGIYSTVALNEGGAIYGTGDLLLNSPLRRLAIAGKLSKISGDNVALLNAGLKRTGGILSKLGTRVGAVGVGITLGTTAYSAYNHTDNTATWIDATLTTVLFVGSVIPSPLQPFFIGGSIIYSTTRVVAAPQIDGYINSKIGYR